jgi:hypothetical protein
VSTEQIGDARRSPKITVHGLDEFDNARADWLPEKIAAADFLFGIGQFAKSRVMRLSAHQHWDKIDIARLGDDPARYRPRSPVRILCVGPLVAAKGQHVLIEAARRLHAPGRPVLPAAGGGTMLALAQRWVTRIVFSHGRLVGLYRRWRRPDGFAWARYLKAHGGLYAMGQGAASRPTSRSPIRATCGSATTSICPAARPGRADRHRQRRLCRPPGDHHAEGAIGSNAIIGAGAVVTRDVAANSMVGGVSERFICTLDACIARSPRTTSVLPRPI